MRGQAEGKLSAGGVSGHAEPLDVELGVLVFTVLQQRVVGGTDVLKGARPSPARIPDAAVFHVPSSDAGVLQPVTQMARVVEVVLRAPIPAVDKKDYRMRGLD